MSNESPIIDHTKEEASHGAFSIAPAKDIIVFLFAMFVLAFIAAFIWFFYYNGVFESDTEEYSSSHSYYPSYVDNKLVVFAEEGVSAEKMEEYISDFGGTIYDDSMADIGIYYVNLDASYAYEELEEICSQLTEYDGIESAFPDCEVFTEPDQDVD